MTNAKIDDFFFARRGYFVFLAVPLLLLAGASSPRPLASDSHWIVDRFDLVGLFVSFLGLVVRMWTIGQVPPGTSSRRRGAPRASTLNTTGPYSIVRHPLYVGNFLIGLGVSLVPRVWWFTASYAVAYLLVIGRVIAAEERALARSFGGAHEAWASRTRALVPNPARWRRSDRPFSIRMILRREYGTWLATAVALLLADTATEVLRARGGLPGRLWVAIGIFGILQFAVLRTLKKNTDLLRIDDRQANSLRRRDLSCRNSSRV